jgi:iron complex outermembrane recepter protein
MINLLKKLAIAACVLNACAVYAFDDVSGEKVAINLSEDDYIGEVPKVLTVSRLTQSKEDAPSAVTVIDRETIRASGIVDIPEIFRLVPGFYVGKSPGYIYNTNHAVSYHGMTSAYSGSMQVLINGRSVYSPLYGGVQWSELPITVDDIDRIEITRGPNAASYGANSFFGVISIITKDAKELAGSSVRLTHGTGRNEAFYRYAGELEDVNFRVSAGYREDDGLDNRNDFKRTNILNLQANKRLDASNELDFELGLTNGDRADGELSKDNIFLLPRTRGFVDHYELIRWRHNVSDDSDFSLQAYHSFNSTDDPITTANLRARFPATPALLSPTLSFSNDFELERFDIEAQHTFAPANNLRVVWGGNIRLDTTYSAHNLANDPTDNFNLQRLFGHVEWRINKQFLINVGSMVEHNTFTGTDNSPRASLNFKLTPNHTLRFGISSATRTPSYVQEKYNDATLVRTVNPNRTYQIQAYLDKGNLDPGRILSREIGYLGQMGDLNVDFRIFDDDIHNIYKRVRGAIPITPANVVYRGTAPANFVNGPDAQVRGFETQLKYQLFQKTQFLVNYSHVNITGDESAAGVGKDYTHSMPENTFSALITHQFDSNWDASYAYYQTGAVTALGDGAAVGLNRWHDVRVARKFDLGRAKAELSIAVENLFDDQYHEFALYNTVGRRALVNLNLNF